MTDEKLKESVMNVRLPEANKKQYEKERIEKSKIFEEVLVNNHKRLFKTVISICVLANIATLIILLTGSGSDNLSAKNLTIEVLTATIIIASTVLITMKYKTERYSGYIAITGIMLAMLVFQYFMTSSQLFAINFIVLVLSVFYFDTRLCVYTTILVILSQVAIFGLRPDLIPAGNTGNTLGVRFLIYIWVGIGATIGAGATRAILNIAINKADESDKNYDKLKIVGENIDRTAGVLKEQIVKQNEITDTVNRLTQTQAVSLEEISASLEELSGNSENISSTAEKLTEEKNTSLKGLENLNNVYLTLKESSLKIKDTTEKIVDYSKESSEQMSLTTEQYNLLEKEAKEMSGFIRVINEIADQVNLLSLNASIEAARAGEYGRGFAVVADEISKLADATSRNSGEIEKLITSNNSYLANSREYIEKTSSLITELSASIFETKDNINGITSIVSEVGEAIKIIATLNENIDELTQSIDQSTKEQEAATEESSKTIFQVSETEQEIVNVTHTISEVTETVGRLSDELLNLTSEMLQKNTQHPLST